MQLLCQQINSQNKSLLHLPPELLQIIFEFAVEHNHYGFKCATKISHVSQKMRRIAISTPRLWSYIHCSMANSESSILEFWGRTLDRVKNIPVDILIRKTVGTKNCHLAVCRFDTISSINSLAFESYNGEFIMELQSPSFAPPTSPVNHLSLRVPAGTFDEWDNSRLARFPPIATLSLFGFRLSYNSYTSLLSIHELRLNYTEMESAVILTYLPNLTFLEIKIHYEPKSVPDSCVLPNLHTLKTWHGNVAWIHQMTCPSITTFIFDIIRSDTDSCGVLRWISIHPTIRRVECRYITLYESLANSCPQLEHLVIGELEYFHPDHIRMPRFPALRTLGFHDHGPDAFIYHGNDALRYLTLELFEQVVRSRCLPASHEQSQLVIGERELESLDIIFLSKKKPTQKHIGGMLYQEAKKTSRMLDAKEIRHLGFKYVGYEGLKWSLSWM
jgi:F-box-like